MALFATVMYRNYGEPNLRRCLVLSADKYTQIHVFVVAFRDVSLACPFLMFRGLEWPCSLSSLGTRKTEAYPKNCGNLHSDLTFLCFGISAGTLLLSVPLVQPRPRYERCDEQIVMVLTLCAIANHRTRKNQVYFTLHILGLPE